MKTPKNQSENSLGVLILDKRDWLRGEDGGGNGYGSEPCLEMGVIWINGCGWGFGSGDRGGIGMGDFVLSGSIGNGYGSGDKDGRFAYPENNYLEHWIFDVL